MLITTNGQAIEASDTEARDALLHLTYSRLIDEAEEAAAFACRLGRRSLRRRDDVRDEIEVQPTVGAERDRHDVLGLEQVGEEQIAVLVEREARIAARVAEVVVVADQASRPARATVEADGGEHPGRQPRLEVADVADDHDVVRVGRIDGDRLFRLVQVPLADVDVRGCRQSRRRRGDTAARGSQRGTHADDAAGGSQADVAHRFLLPQRERRVYAVRALLTRGSPLLERVSGSTRLERTTGFEPATPGLGSQCSTD